jgi:hypothetical protein
MAVVIVVSRAEVGEYTRQREGDAARLACEEAVWLWNIVDQLL